MCKICVCFHARIGNFATIRNRISAATELSSGRRGWGRRDCIENPSNSKQFKTNYKNSTKLQRISIHTFALYYMDECIHKYVCLYAH